MGERHWFLSAILPRVQRPFFSTRQRAEKNNLRVVYPVTHFLFRYQSTRISAWGVKRDDFEGQVFIHSGSIDCARRRMFCCIVLHSLVF